MGMTRGRENGSVAFFGKWAVEGKENEEALWQDYGPHQVSNEFLGFVGNTAPAGASKLESLVR
jgi:hypothetical protein